MDVNSLMIDFEGWLRCMSYNNVYICLFKKNVELWGKCLLCQKYVTCVLRIYNWKNKI